jgi:hypothetical protein
MSNGLCARCGSSGYGCYECTPKTYTHDQMKAAIKRALQAATKLAYRYMGRFDAHERIRALDPERFIEEKKP